MSFEKIGRLFFANMRPPFFFTLLICPVLAALLFLFFEQSSLEELEMRFVKAARNEKMAHLKKLRKDRFLKEHTSANPYFLDQQIESLVFLQEERSQLESLCRHPAFPNPEPLKERLRFLDQNRWSFTEETIHHSSKVKETEEKQRHPVQMNEQDLQKALSLIEHVAIGPHRPPTDSPQLVIKDFRMKKQHTSLQVDVFEIEMNLLKREFTQ